METEKPSNLTQSDPPEIFCNLLTTHALATMVESMPDLASQLDKIKTPATRHGYYPDGTLFIEGKNSFDRIWDMVLRNGLLDGGLWQPCGFGSLEPFPDKGCALWYTSDYREGLGELEFGVIFPSIWSCPTKEYDLAKLLISVGFTRKPSAEIQRRFAACLGDWFRSVSQHGMFDDGPIKLVSKAVEFRGRVAQFRVDASGSGQDTLNWLLLAVLNFGYSVSPVLNFIFNHEKKMELFIGHSLGDEVERILIPLPHVAKATPEASD